MLSGIYIRTEEIKRKLSEAAKGKHPSEETRKKMSERIKKQWADGKRTACIPRHLSDRECLICKKIFRPLHFKRNKYCSKKCGDLGKRNGRYIKCEECGKLRWVRQSHIDSHKSLYCSKECANIGHSKRMKKIFSKGSGNPMYRSGRRYEYKAVADLYLQGFNFVTRSPGSKGIFDVWGLKFTSQDCNLKLIQVKGMKNTRTFKSAMTKKDRTIMFKGILNDNFKWFGLKGVPKWATIVHFEIWVYEKRKECHKFRLIFKNDAREPEITEV